jgi:hypothetical protein
MKGIDLAPIAKLRANHPVRVQRIIDSLDRFNDACLVGETFLPGNVAYLQGQLNRVLLEVTELKAEMEQAAVAALAMMGKRSDGA